MKVVVSGISIILVVGVVIAVVAVVQHGKSDSRKDVNLSSSTRTVNTLCTPALYKNACIKTLGSMAQNESVTAQDIVKAGVKMAMEEITKALNLTDTLHDKVGQSKNVGRANMSIDECKNLFGMAVERLNAAMDKVGDSSVYKDESKTWNLRIWLTDVITFATDCVDSFEEDSPEIQKTMKDGTANATELTMSVLDIVTTFSKALGELGVNLSKLTELALGDDKINRQLLRTEDIQVNSDGYPNWITDEDRRMLASQPAPNAVVALDGSGQFKSIQAAVDSIPKDFKGRFIIHVKAGTYKEAVLIKKKPNIFMYGDGPEKTIVTGHKSFAKGVQTSKTATFVVESPGFQCKDMCFQNTAGPDGHQAVALRVNNLQAVFFNCKFEAYQDTLYAQSGSQFFRDCTISGTVDFIFGNGATLIQNSKIIVRKPNPNQFNAVTAHGRLGPSEPTAIVIQGCEILPEKELVADRLKTKTYLGRPWKPYARTIFIETTMGDLIQPDGYSPWNGDVHLATCMYGEYANSGLGAKTALRVKWKNVKVLSKAEALEFTAERFLPAGPTWIKEAAVPLDASLKA